VKTTGRYEQLPAAETDGTTQYFAWSQNSRAHRNHFDSVHGPHPKALERHALDPLPANTDDFERDLELE